MYAEAGWLWSQTTPEDWNEAISHHPRIGDVDKLRERFKATGAWSEQEQKGIAGAAVDVIQALADGNREYEERFGFIFLICATGKSAREMLEHLRERMNNPPAAGAAHRGRRAGADHPPSTGEAPHLTMSTLSTHVLDTQWGRPAAGVPITLEFQDGRAAGASCRGARRTRMAVCGTSCPRARACRRVPTG